jgi:anti-sigma B factor antagonist
LFDTPHPPRLVKNLNEIAPPDAPVPGQLVVESKSDGDAIVLLLQGELDLTSAPIFERGLRAAEAATPARLVIDLSGLEFMDSTGLRALLLARERAGVESHKLTLRRGPRQVQRVLELTKTVDAFEFED